MPRLIRIAQGTLTVYECKLVIKKAVEDLNKLPDQELIRFVKAAQRANRVVLRTPREEVPGEND